MSNLASPVVDPAARVLSGLRALGVLSALPLLARAAALVGVGFLAACDRSGAPDSAGSPAATFDSAQGGAAIPTIRKVTLQLNWVAEPEFGGFYAAKEKALFEAEGLDVELVQGGPGVPAAQLVAGGKVEFGVVSGPQVIELERAGGDLVALYAVYQGNPMGVMVHEASPFQSLEELWKSGSTVSIESGLAEFKWLAHTYPGGSLKIVPYAANLAQFAGDPALAQQCFVVSEPVSLALQGVKTRVFPIGGSGFDPYNAVVVTQRPFFEANRALCAGLVKALAAGWRAYLDDPRPSNATMARLNAGMSVEAMNMGAERQRHLIETDETKRVGLGGMRAERWQLLVDQLAEIGEIEEKPEPGRLFHWDVDAGTAR